MKFSNDELKSTIKKMVGIILRGTRVEMEWSACLLGRNGIECTVVKDDSAAAGGDGAEAEGPWR
jgi:hypothetical protein